MEKLDLSPFLLPSAPPRLCVSIFERVRISRMSIASTFTGPDPVLVVVGLALVVWVARLAITYFAARRWQLAIGDLLWLTLFFGITLTYMLLLR